VQNKYVMFVNILITSHSTQHISLFGLADLFDIKNLANHLLHLKEVYSIIETVLLASWKVLLTTSSEDLPKPPQVASMLLKDDESLIHTCPHVCKRKVVHG
jgi:hypothetical protein